MDGEPALLDCPEFEGRLRYLDHIDAAFGHGSQGSWARKKTGGYFLAGYAVRVIPPRRRCATCHIAASRGGAEDEVRGILPGQTGGHGRRAPPDHRHPAPTARYGPVGAGRWQSEGTGKSTHSPAGCELVGAQVISTDDVRGGYAMRVITGSQLDSGSTVVPTLWRSTRRRCAKPACSWVVNSVILLIPGVIRRCACARRHGGHALGDCRIPGVRRRLT